VSERGECGGRSLGASQLELNSHIESSQTYPVNIQIEAIDRGVLKDILSRLSDHSINVRNAQVKTFEGQPAVIELGIEIRDRQLEHIFTHIKKMSDILNLRRLGQLRSKRDNGRWDLQFLLSKCQACVENVLAFFSTATQLFYLILTIYQNHHCKTPDFSTWQN